MKDRVTAGFIGGIIAGIAMNIIDYITIITGFNKEHLYDWAAIVVFGKLAKNIGEIITAQMFQILFAGLLGIIFSYFLLKLTSGNYLIKGWIYGFTTWFAIYAVSIALRLPHLDTHTLNSVISHFLSSSVYGITLAEALHRLNNKKLIT